ncbi:MAG: hypothetical protein CSYNP_00862 [Syntrophus sp. SKADARSKE-3]|nr:hypothetical protein [Syntrophus sp. SKADARSKE-3]
MLRNEAYIEVRRLSLPQAKAGEACSATKQMDIFQQPEGEVIKGNIL